MPKIRLHLIVYGRVQGVFFRDSTKKKAKQLAVTGWVKNLENGSVEAIFEGEEVAVNEALNFVKQGPPLARVEKVEVEKLEYSSEFSDFQIIR